MEPLTINPSVVTAKKPNILKRIGNKISRVYWNWNTPKDYSDEVTDMTECAQFSNRRVAKLTGKAIYGDAWTRSNPKNNMTKIISGYDGLTRPESWDEKQVKNYVYDAANNVKHGLKRKIRRNLKEGDVVGMFYRNSPNWEKAYNQGMNGEAQTHTGHIVFRHGKPYVEHNVHGDIIVNKLNDVLGSRNPWGVVSIYRPSLKQGGFLPRVKSGIKIKPENKGKFTETKKRTGKTTEELTHSKNPITKKRAIFAQNAKKWNHKK